MVTHSSKTSTGTQDVTQSSEPAALPVSAEKLFEDYQKNEVAADQIYKDRILSVSGRVKSINKDFADDIYLVLDTSNEFESVQALLRSSEESRAASLSRGEFLTVVCTGNGMIIGSPMLKDCLIQTSQQHEATDQQMYESNPPAVGSEAAQQPAPAPVENSNPPAVQPAAQQETAPAPLENTKPASSPNTVEIEEQAVELLNAKRYSKAAPFLEQACSSDRAYTCYYLGSMYSLGQGVAKDTEKGKQLLSKACSLGYERACNVVK
jgi:TPR repeat protein